MLRVVGFEVDNIFNNSANLNSFGDPLDSIVGALEDREHVHSVFLDLSKVFDCAQHATLLLKLELCGIRGLPLPWLRTHIECRTQCVHIAHPLSSIVPINQGDPQESILVLVLFLI